MMKDSLNPEGSLFGISGTSHKTPLILHCRGFISRRRFSQSLFFHAHYYILLLICKECYRMQSMQCDYIPIYLAVIGQFQNLFCPISHSHKFPCSYKYSIEHLRIDYTYQDKAVYIVMLCFSEMFLYRFE